MTVHTNTVSKYVSSYKRLFLFFQTYSKQTATDLNLCLMPSANQWDVRMRHNHVYDSEGTKLAAMVP